MNSLAKNIGFLALALAIAVVGWFFYRALGEWAGLVITALAFWVLWRNQKPPKFGNKPKE